MRLFIFSHLNLKTLLPQLVDLNLWYKDFFWHPSDDGKRSFTYNNVMKFGIELCCPTPEIVT